MILIKLALWDVKTYLHSNLHIKPIAICPIFYFFIHSQQGKNAQYQIYLDMENDIDTIYSDVLSYYNDVIMGAIASQITSLTIVYSTVYSDADQRKYQSSASLAFVWVIHWWPVYSPHKWPVTRKMPSFDDVIMETRFIWLIAPNRCLDLKTLHVNQLHCLVDPVTLLQAVHFHQEPITMYVFCDIHEYIVAKYIAVLIYGAVKKYGCL